jgi:hypothetical protein
VDDAPNFEPPPDRDILEGLVGRLTEERTCCNFRAEIVCGETAKSCCTEAMPF